MLTDDEILDSYRSAVDASMRAVSERDGFASNMSRGSRLAGLRAIEREAAARALEEAAEEIFVQPPRPVGDEERESFDGGADAVYSALRNRAANIRKEGK